MIHNGTTWGNDRWAWTPVGRAPVSDDGRVVDVAKPSFQKERKKIEFKPAFQLFEVKLAFALTNS